MTAAATESDEAWLVLQLADSAFPTGGFAHSGGLETAAQLGEVSDLEGVVRFLDASLYQAGLGALPAVRAAHASPADLAAIDATCEAMLLTHIARRASRTQGRALIATAARIFPAHELKLLDADVRAARLHGHVAPLFGVTARALGMGREATARVFLHLAARSVCSAAVRLGLVGPHEAQRLQYEARGTLERVLEESASFGVDDMAQPSPLLEIFGAAHDRLYARLFLS